MTSAKMLAKGIDPRLYRAWSNMRDRCHNSNNRDYYLYGGRGIVVCIRWDTYANFAADMGPHPGKGWTLDRKDSNKNYCHSNCRWATPKTQRRNQRFGPKLKLTLAQAQTIRQRYIAGTNQFNPGNRMSLAVEYGVNDHHIWQIAKGVVWQ